MNVEKGIILEISIKGDFLGSKDIQTLEELLTGNIHDPQTIRMRLSQSAWKITLMAWGMRNFYQLCSDQFSRSVFMSINAQLKEQSKSGKHARKESPRNLAKI